MVRNGIFSLYVVFKYYEPLYAGTKGGIIMDQVKVGSFLRELRKEKKLTQEELAEYLNVSNRTISRWETGNNMPDIGMLVEIATFYNVSIPEIVDGERKSEIMKEEIRDTAVKMVEYSQHEVKVGKKKVECCLLIVFGIFLMLSALVVFPSESSWGGFYSVIGGLVFCIGIFIATNIIWDNKKISMVGTLGCVVILFGIFSLSDYIAVTEFNQVPRFRYMTSWSSEAPNQVEYKTLFFNAVQYNPGQDNEKIEIVEAKK